MGRTRNTRKFIKAVKTKYKGITFRSRLEAKHAVVFDAIGEKWEYEPKQFDLGDYYMMLAKGSGSWQGIPHKNGYIPDFYLRNSKTWVEIKPVLPKPEDPEIRKILGVLYKTNEPVVLLGGDLHYKKGTLTYPIGYVAANTIPGPTLLTTAPVFDMRTHRKIVEALVAFDRGKLK